MPDEKMDEDLPEGVETANTSTRHAELQEKARKSYSKLSMIRLTFTWVAILCSGIGGMMNGLLLANQVSVRRKGPDRPVFPYRSPKNVPVLRTGLPETGRSF